MGLCKIWSKIANMMNMADNDQERWVVVLGDEQDSIVNLMKVFWHHDAIPAGERVSGFIESQKRRRDD